MSFSFPKLLPLLRSTFSVSRRDAIVLLLCLLVMLTSFILLFRTFLDENSVSSPSQGGQYTEGVIGFLPPDYSLNPLFAQGFLSDVSRMLFGSLMQYNPETGEVEDSFADHTLSEDYLTYTFQIHEGITWHDGEPVTVDDVIYTFRDVIQHPDFPNRLLHASLQNVTIEQVSAYEVKFTIPEVREAFINVFTTPLLPRHLLVGTPIVDLPSPSLPFNNTDLVGSGPFVFGEVGGNGNATQVVLLANESYALGRPLLDEVVFRIYETPAELSLDQSSLDGIRPIPSSRNTQISLDERLQDQRYLPPDYLAVYFNLKDDTLTTREIRQAMRAAIDTTLLAQEHFGVRVDTPLTELWPQDDIVNVDQNRAIELLEEAGYTYRPEQAFLESSEAFGVGGPEPARFIQEPEPFLISVLSSDENAFLSGSFPEGTTSVAINGFVLQQFSAEDGTFLYRLSEQIQTIAPGENSYLVQFLNDGGDEIDSERVTILFEPDLDRAKELRAEIEADDPAPEEAEEEGTEDSSETDETLQDIPPEASEEESEAPSEEEPTEEPAEEPAEETLEEAEPAPEPVTPQLSPWRTNAAGNRIQLTLSYLQGQENAPEIASALQDSWRAVGIEILLDPLETQDFRRTIQDRSYELVLAGQSLGYDSEPYAYFHLSQADTGLNIANWKDLKASLLLEEIRNTHDPDLRFDRLSQLRDIIIDEVPGIFLMAPEYSWHRSQKLQSIPEDLHLTQASDRVPLLTLASVQGEPQLLEGVGLLDFFPWFWEKSRDLFSPT